LRRRAWRSQIPAHPPVRGDSPLEAAGLAEPDPGAPPLPGGGVPPLEAAGLAEPDPGAPPREGGLPP
jgi:hypothetical protein